MSKENLPLRHISHEQEFESRIKFENLIPMNKFIYREESGGDYGTDSILEIIKESGMVTNYRSHVQIKSKRVTKRLKNGSVSFPVEVKTINYLINTPSSLYFLYLKDEGKFLWEWVANIYERFHRDGYDLATTPKKKINFHFNKELDSASFDTIYNTMREADEKLRESLKSNIAFQPISQLKLIYARHSSIFSDFEEDESSILKSFEDKYQTAEKLFEQEQYNEALQEYKNILTFLKSNKQINLKCAALTEILGKYDECIEYCDTLLEHEEIEEAYIMKGTCKGFKKEYDEAIKLILKAIEIRPSIISYHNLGYIYLLNEKVKLAIESYEKCIEIDPSYSPAYLNLSICYLDQYKVDKSIKYINKAIELDPNSHFAYAAKGDINKFLGLYNEAIKEYEKCLSIDSSHYPALLNISLSLFALGKNNEGYIHLRDLLKNHENKLFSKGKNALIFDLGWDNTVSFAMEKIADGKVKISNLNGYERYLEYKTNDFIQIGVISHGKIEGCLPIVGKKFEKDRSYKEVITQIKKSIKLKENHHLLISEENDIKVKIKEKEKNVYQEIDFGGKYCISGMTSLEEKEDGKYKSGFNFFAFFYKIGGEAAILLENLEKGEEVLIGPIKEVEIDSFEK
ncbi:DUF4365 domain-containing protein [Gracilibacillus sp. YIM 98692]|uniref:DUF4365 domain-containing protein n=1 Tax=Gracilibacillus sp. YIM 98692 TaxID=2663532 RepID=UPI0013D18DE1|nr:DUF4365 domain-containing protein [Gracilibacillus sp. YIM 98692]